MGGADHHATLWEDDQWGGVDVVRTYTTAWRGAIISNDEHTTRKYRSGQWTVYRP
jgi:hypothetical protein